jgi:hypothetical protein
MVNSIEGFRVVRSVAVLSLLVALAAMTAFPQSGSTQSFNVPDDTALRIRLDDTLTSTDSQVGDPFSATVVEKGEYQGATCTATSRKLTCPEKSRATPA